MVKTISQKVFFKATPKKVYEMLMDSDKHSGFTESSAKIHREVGGRFTAYDGWIEGDNLELVPNKRIVQSWRGGNWPEGHYSTATFELKAVDDGTNLSFTQTNVPDEFYKAISKGWIEHYWEKMEKNPGKIKNISMCMHKKKILRTCLIIISSFCL